jgi:hypothetical protein
MFHASVLDNFHSLSHSSAEYQELSCLLTDDEKDYFTEDMRTGYTACIAKP